MSQEGGKTTRKGGRQPSFLDVLAGVHLKKEKEEKERGWGRTLRRNDPCHLRHLCNLDRQVRCRDPQKARVVLERVDDVVDVERPDVGRAEEDGGLDESFLEA